MQYESEINVRLNDQGEPDIEYYLANAQQMRSEALSGWMKAFGAWLIGILDDAWSSNRQYKGPLQRVVQSDWPWVDMIVQGNGRKAGHA